MAREAKATQQPGFMTKINGPLFVGGLVPEAMKPTEAALVLLKEEEPKRKIQYLLK